MKTTILTVALCLVTSMAFAQKKAVNKAYSEAKGGNIGEARNQIKQALENPETKDQAKTWWTAGYVELQAFETERNKLLENKTPDDKVLYPAILECLPMTRYCIPLFWNVLNIISKRQNLTNNPMKREK